MKKKETSLCHTFIGTVPLVVGKRFLFEAEGQSPRQMCVVRDCPLPTSGVSWMPGYAIADYMSGLIFPCSSHDTTEKEAIGDFLARMRELKIRPDDITSVAKRFNPEDIKWSTADLSALPCVVKMHVKQTYGICL